LLIKLLNEEVFSVFLMSLAEDYVGEELRLRNRLAGLLNLLYENRLDSVEGPEEVALLEKAFGLNLNSEFVCEGKSRRLFVPRFDMYLDNLLVQHRTGRWPSQVGLAKKHGLSQAAVSRYLSRAGFKARAYNVFDGSKIQEMIIRGHEHGIDAYSLVSFLDLPVSGRHLFRSLRSRGVEPRNGILKVPYLKKGLFLYKVAGFYEARDAGFGFKDSLEFGGLKSEVQGRYLDAKRRVCSPIVAGAVGVLFGESKSRKPYVTDDLRAKLRNLKSDNCV